MSEGKSFHTHAPATGKARKVFVDTENLILKAYMLSFATIRDELMKRLLTFRQKCVNYL